MVMVPSLLCVAMEIRNSRTICLRKRRGGAYPDFNAHKAMDVPKKIIVKLKKELTKSDAFSARCACTQCELVSKMVVGVLFQNGKICAMFHIETKGGVLG